MERVVFLLEDSGERLGCLLNPESVVLRRWAGIRPRHSLNGPLTGAALQDDPLLYTGGGATELNLDLLFDVAIGGSTLSTEDVRHLTAPLWDLAETRTRPPGYGGPPRVRLVWGKSWNILVVVVAVAERLEHFTAGGAPRRSWLRLRLLRVAESRPGARPAPASPLAVEALPEAAAIPAERVGAHEAVGGGAGAEGVERLSGERLDQIAARYYGDPSLWRLLAHFNNLQDPLHISPGQVIQIPPLDSLGVAG